MNLKEMLKIGGISLWLSLPLAKYARSQVVYQPTKIGQTQQQKQELFEKYAGGLIKEINEHSYLNFIPNILRIPEIDSLKITNYQIADKEDTYFMVLDTTQKEALVFPTFNDSMVAAIQFDLFSRDNRIRGYMEIKGDNKKELCELKILLNDKKEDLIKHLIYTTKNVSSIKINNLKPMPDNTLMPQTSEIVISPISQNLETRIRQNAKEILKY